MNNIITSKNIGFHFILGFIVREEYPENFRRELVLEVG
jgi:hypothetical protein